jgi:hypothetical protein
VAHLENFAATDLGRGLKTLKGFMPYEAVQGMDKRARAIQTRSIPSNAGAKQLVAPLERSW